MPEIIKNNYNGLLVKPNKPKLLSEAIKQLYNSSLRRKFSSNGYLFVKKNFSIKKMYSQTINVYKLKKNEKKNF